MDVADFDTVPFQKAVFENKKAHGFNTDDIDLEFCLLYGEVAEAFDAYRKEKDTLGEELADVGIYLLSLAEMCGVDLGEEMKKKHERNTGREYEKNSRGAFVEKK